VPAPFPTHSRISPLVPAFSNRLRYQSARCGDRRCSPSSLSGGTEPPTRLAGFLDPEIRIRVESFYSSVYEIVERWVNRPRSLHTRRSHKEGVLSFVRYRGIVWPQEASSLFLVSVAEVQEYRDCARRRPAPLPKPSITGFRPSLPCYKHLALSAAEFAVAHRCPQSGAQSVHRPRVLRSTGRNALCAGGAGATTAEFAYRRFHAGLAGPGHPEALPS
jgi:hypothetical protein